MLTPNDNVIRKNLSKPILYLQKGSNPNYNSNQLIGIFKVKLNACYSMLGQSQVHYSIIQ